MAARRPSRAKGALSCSIHSRERRPQRPACSGRAGAGDRHRRPGGPGNRPGRARTGLGAPAPAPVELSGDWVVDEGWRPADMAAVTADQMIGADIRNADGQVMRLGRRPDSQRRRQGREHCRHLRRLPRLRHRERRPRPRRGRDPAERRRPGHPAHRADPRRRSKAALRPKADSGPLHWPAARSRGGPADAGPSGVAGRLIFLPFQSLTIRARAQTACLRGDATRKSPRRRHAASISRRFRYPLIQHDNPPRPHRPGPRPRHRPRHLRRLPRLRRRLQGMEHQRPRRAPLRRRPLRRRSRRHLSQPRPHLRGRPRRSARARVVHFPKSCLHCADAACVTVCPTGASFKRAEDGIVLVNEDDCIGCGLCAWACPYGAREMDRVAGVMKKCTLCVDRIDNADLPEVDRIPACVRTCPTGARHFGDLADPASPVSRLVAERGGIDLMPEQGTRPVNKYLPPRDRDVDVLAPLLDPLPRRGRLPRLARPDARPPLDASRPVDHRLHDPLGPRLRADRLARLHRRRRARRVRSSPSRSPRPACSRACCTSASPCASSRRSASGAAPG